MKFSMQNFLSVLLFTAVLLPLFSGEKATIHYKNGSTLDCVIENYEIGKYAEVIDEKGNKRIISWDNISEVVFIKEEEKPVIEEEVTTETVTDAEESRPKNAAERWAEKNDQEAQTDVDYDRKTGKISAEYYKTLESDSKRRSWIENGGVLQAKSLTLNYTHASMEMDLTGDGNETDFKMNGFGFAYAWAFKFISPPNYEQEKNLWTAFSLAVMGSFNMTVGEIDMTYDLLNETYNDNYSIEALTYEISTNIGYTFGLGRFFTQEEWKGVMLGLYWKPNFTISRNFTTVTSDNPYMGDSYSEGEPTSTFNPTGLQWTLDWGSFGALSSTLAKEAHFTINGFILPETKETPLLISIGLGAVWY